MNMRDLIPWSRNGERGSLARTEAPNPLLDLQRDMNRVFDDFWRGFDLPATAFGRSVWPTLDVSETDTEYKVTAELPGVEEKDVELTVRENALTLSGDKRNEREDRDAGRYYAERFHGRFSRTLQLPTDVDPEKAAASFKNGVLTVVLPKHAQARDNVKRIPIQKLN
jgi:HSP20 family protein